MNATEHSQTNHTFHHWLLGISGGIGVLSLLPYALPWLGIAGRAEDASNIMHFIGTPTEDNSFGTGIAGWLQKGIAAVPGIGSALTDTAPTSVFGLSISSGALTSIATSSVIGIGGALLANWLEHHENPDASIRWSKVIRIVSLTTSILIALPSVLGAISVAVTFLASLVGPGAGTDTAFHMSHTFGATTAHAGVAGGISSALSHFITCGAAILPVSLAYFVGKQPPATKIDAATAEVKTPQKPLQPAAQAL